MKTLIASTILFLMSSMAFSQSVDKVEAQAFWDNNIQSILDGDIDAVVEQSVLPMVVFEEEMDEEMFREAYEYIFDENVIATLMGMSYRDIELIDEDPKALVYMVSIYSEIEEEGEIYESMTFLSFKKFDGKWKLSQIDIAG